MTPTVRAARIEEVPAVLEVLGLAFASDPAMRWTFPRAVDYVRWQARFMMGMAGRAFEHGSAFVTDDLSAVALWLPPGVSGDPEVMGRSSPRPCRRRNSRWAAPLAN
jgi:hypothetical protein